MLDNNSRIEDVGKGIFATLGVGILALSIPILLATLVTALFAIVTAVNVAMYYFSGGFLVAPIWFVTWYATSATILFYLVLVIRNIQVLIVVPPLIVLSVPFSLFVFVVVSGSVDLLNGHISTATQTGMFTKEMLIGIIHSAVGVSALSSDSDE